jgi:hypothetical protein
MNANTTKTARTSTTRTNKTTAAARRAPKANKTTAAALKAWATRRKLYGKASGHDAAVKAWETIHANREAAAKAEAKAARAAKRNAKK